MGLRKSQRGHGIAFARFHVDHARLETLEPRVVLETVAGIVGVAHFRIGIIWGAEEILAGFESNSLDSVLLNILKMTNTVQSMRC